MATTIILFATPFFFLLIFIELYVNKKRNAGVYRLNDALTSLSLGVISQTKKLVIFSFAAIVYAWAPNSLAIFHLPQESVFTWIFGFIFYDFLYYWFHRVSHNINFLWASHVVHHQSEEYNLTTALRQTSSSVMPWIFYIPSFVVGIPAEVFFVSGALNLIYQYWVHTQLIGKLGWYESIFVTPSHHRVHHGQNEIYIDKNHGGVFILWDKWFGTFQEELDEEKVVYGVRRPLNSFNPIWANLHTWFSLLSDAIRTKNWLDKLKIWFMPTGWRPTDVEERFPITKQPAGEQIKYNPEPNQLIKLYTLIQYIFVVMFSVLFIQASMTLSFTAQLIIWCLITSPLLINGWLLESKNHIKAIELVRIILSAVALYFLLDYFPNWIFIAGVLYLIVSILFLTFLSREST
ncbi:MAG: sterol desaturase family protein [Kangiellaceae bacterium]